MRCFFLTGLSAMLVLTGCLDRGEYPSLKPRGFETAQRDASPPVLPPAPARPGLVSATTALLAKGQAGQRAFAAELAVTRPVVARAGAADSESWITAQQQLSALDAARVDTVTAAADLDALNLSGADADGRFGEADLAVLREAGEHLGALLNQQQRELAALASSLQAP